MEQQEHQCNHKNQLVTLYWLGVWMLTITKKNLKICLVVRIHCIDGKPFRTKSVLQIWKIYLLAAVKLAGMFPF